MGRRTTPVTMAVRVLGALAGVAAAAALAVFIDRLYHSGPIDPLAGLVNVGLVVAFGALHSFTAARRIKRRLAALSPALPRTAHLVGSAAAVAALIVFWQPVGGTIWNLDGTPAYAVEAAYWLLLAAGTAAIVQLDPLAFFGLRDERPGAGFRASGIYRIVRHPLYAVIILALPCGPTMGLDRVLLAVLFTTYTLAALPREEAKLVARFGDAYVGYQSSVPRLLPRLRVR
jgi:methanethiol S-methyltransferase